MVSAWCRLEGEIREAGPTQPLERNFVLDHGPAIWAYYRGFAITIFRSPQRKRPVPLRQQEVMEETQIIRRYTSTRQVLPRNCSVGADARRGLKPSAAQVQVQSSFAFVPQPGDRFRVHAPETDKTKETICKELFYMEDLDGCGALTV